MTTKKLHVISVQSSMEHLDDDKPMQVTQVVTVRAEIWVDTDGDGIIDVTNPVIMAFQGPIDHADMQRPIEQLVADRLREKGRI